jgi:hypothetical protein
MPENTNFTLTSTTLGAVFPTSGVLMAEGTESFDIAIVGAYFDSADASKGLYVVKPEGEILYFDIDMAEVKPQGDGRLVRFDYENSNYLIRPFYEEDGAWISKYKISIPKIIIEKKVSADSVPALRKYAGLDFGGEPAPFFEMLTAFTTASEADKKVVSLDYVTSFGTFSRVGAEWIDSDLSAEYYEDFEGSEIAPEKAVALLEKYDSQQGIISIQDVDDAAIESSK